MGRKNVFLMGDTAFLPGAKAAVVMTEDVGFLEDKKFTATVITPAKGSSVKKEVRFVPFGHQDKLPVRIMKKIADNTIVGSNIEFKANMAYGDGLMVCRRVKNPETQKIELEELTPEEAPEIFQFISDSNYLRVMSELANDLVVFSDSFVYLAFGKRKAGEKPKVVQIWHREMCFSRISELFLAMGRGVISGRRDRNEIARPPKPALRSQGPYRARTRSGDRREKGRGREWLYVKPQYAGTGAFLLQPPLLVVHLPRLVRVQLRHPEIQEGVAEKSDGLEISRLHQHEILGQALRLGRYPQG